LKEAEEIGIKKIGIKKGEKNIALNAIGKVLIIKLLCT